jgi:hypothetical protein
MRRLPVLLTAVVLGCGSSHTPVLTPTSGGEVHVVGEGSVVVLVRPHAVGVRVQLWIDAGSIDAAQSSAPELAALAAWVAEGRDAEHRVHARVVPDGTVLEIRANTLEEALPPLALALGARDPSSAELERAQTILRERRRGRAVDPLAVVETAAAEALLGPLDPLGLSSEDERTITLEMVAGFLAAHYGPRRARWVVVGALDTDDVRTAVLDHVATLPRALEDAATRRPIASVSARAIEESPAYAFAVLDPRGPDALGGASGLGGAPVDRHARFATPCGELALASGVGAPEHLAELAFALAGGPAAPSGTELDARADAERAGLRFVARRERCTERPEAPLASAILAALDPSSDHTANVLARMDAALHPTEAARIEHLDVDGHTTLLVFTLAGGPIEDPADAHGASAILARALSTRCDVHVAIEAQRLVFSRAFSDPNEAAIARALACVLVDPMPDAFLETARAQALGALDDDALFLARAALALAPGSPGLVAPLGSPSGLAGASDLRGALRRYRALARLEVALVSPNPPSEALTRALGTLPVGEHHEVGVSGMGEPETFVPAIEASTVEVIVALRVDHAADAGPADGHTVAALLADELDATPLSVTRVASGSASGSSWVAIGVSGPDAAIDRIDELLASAVARAEERLDAALQAAAITRHDSDRTQSEVPAALARDRLIEEPPAPDPLASRTLLHAPIHRVIVRPSTPPVRTRR